MQNSLLVIKDGTPQLFGETKAVLQNLNQAIQQAKQQVQQTPKA